MRDERQELHLHRRASDDARQSCKKKRVYISSAWSQSLPGTTSRVESHQGERLNVLGISHHGFLLFYLISILFFSLCVENKVPGGTTLLEGKYTWRDVLTGFKMLVIATTLFPALPCWANAVSLFLYPFSLFSPTGQ